MSQRVKAATPRRQHSKTRDSGTGEGGPPAAGDPGQAAHWHVWLGTGSQAPPRLEMLICKNEATMTPASLRER